MNNTSSYDKSAKCTQQTSIRVFVLSGASHQGKTTTLNKLAGYIRTQPAWNQFEGSNPPQQGDADDRYTFGRQDGLRVGISTRGDNINEIQNGFSFFALHRCDVCFIASKLWGDSVKQIEKECAAKTIIPQYHYLHGEYGPRTRNAVQSDIVSQLYNMI